MTVPRVSVVLLCYDRPEMLSRALASVEAQRFRDLEVIVINNRSARSGEIAGLVRRYPAFRLIEMPGNTGFTGGMNRGIAEARGEFIHLTQEDIALDERCIEQLVAAFDADESLDLGCPLMIDHASGRIRSAGGWFRLDPVYRQADFAAGEPPESFSEARVVTYIPGNMMFARASFFRELSGFRESFFLYFEDVELCARALRGSKHLAVLPAARVSNLDPPSNAPASAAAEMHKIKNFYALYLLHAEGGVLVLFFVRYAVIAVMRSLFAGGAALRLKALGWVARNLSGLLRDRRRMDGLKPAALRTKLARIG